MKKCITCKQEKELNEFYTDNQKKDGKMFKCKICSVKSVVEYQRKNKTKIKFIHLKNETGVTEEQYFNLLKLQNNQCCICKSHIKDNNKNFSIDHCHDKKLVRGLLCSRCNLGLGYFKDNKDLLESAFKYLVENNFIYLNINFKEPKQNKRKKYSFNKKKYKKVMYKEK